MKVPLLLILSLLILLSVRLLLPEEEMPGPGKIEQASAQTLEIAQPGEAELATAPPEEEPAARERRPAPAGPAAGPAPSPVATVEEPRTTQYQFGDEHLDIVVVDPDGSPVKRVQVWVFGNGIKVEELASFAILSLESEDGHYRIEGLSRGLWNVVVEDLPLRCASLADTERAHPVPHPGPPPVFVMVPPGQMKGTVRDGAGTPVEADIRLGSAVLGDLLHPPEQSDEETGEYGFQLLPPGLYRVWAESNLGKSVVREVEVASNKVTIQVNHVVPTGAWIDLVVLDANGALLHDAKVALLNDSPFLDQAANVDEEGRMSWGPLPPGKWTVLALTDGESGKILSEVVTLTAGERRTVKLRVQDDGILVTGTLETGTEDPSRTELLFMREGGSFGEGLSIAEVVADGRFETMLPGPGPYMVCTDRGQMISRVVVPDKTSWEVHLSLPTGTVAGMMILPKGGTGFWKIVLQREDRYMDIGLPGTGEVGVLTSAALFKVRHVRPGRYRLLAIPADDSTRAWFAAPVTGVEVLAGQAVEGIKVPVVPAASLVVRLRHPDGGLASIGGATLRVHTPEGITLVHHPNAESTTLLRSLPRGEILVSAQTEGEFASKRVLIRPAPPLGVQEQPAEVELVLARGGFITLRSERGGEPASAGLQLYGEAGVEVTDLTGSREPGFQDLITSSERRFGPLPPGNYEATALSPDGLSARAATQVEAGEQREVMIRFD